MKALKAFLSVVLLSVTAFLSSAQSTRVDSVSFDVRLQDDGSAFVTEVWSMYAGSEGTEMYQPHYYLRQGDVEMDIAGLAVSDETGRQFVSEGKGWDTNRSRRAKEGRCGLERIQVEPTPMAYTGEAADESMCGSYKNR